MDPARTAAPNILFIVVDCLRADRVRGVGGAETPTLERLKRDGTWFTETIASATHTPPSFATLLTGRHPFIHGVRGMRSKLGTDLVVLPEILRDRGYHTAARVTGPLIPEAGMARGFDDHKWRHEGRYLDTGWGAELRSEIANMPRPWFLLLHLWELHWPRRIPLRYQRARYGSTRYDRALSALDARLAELARALPGDTVVSLTGDHGERIDTAYDRVGSAWLVFAEVARALWRAYRSTLAPRLPAELRGRLDIRREVGFEHPMHGHDLHEYLIRVPWILWGPGVPCGRRVDSQVRHVDLAPTILDLAGAAIPEGFEASLLPPIRAGRVDERPAYAEAAATEGPRERPETWLTCLRAGGHKYVTAPYAGTDEGRLMDLRTDPAAIRDISAETPDRAREMRTHLLGMLAEARSVHAPLTPEEERKVAHRLAELGYLEDV